MSAGRARAGTELRGRYSLDLDSRSRNQPASLKRCPRRWILPKVLAEDLVHCHELPEVGHVDGDLGDLSQRRAGRFQHRLEVFAYLPRLGLDPAIGQASGFRVNPELA